MLSAFRPGQMGGVALANLLAGKANPSGKLAQSWVRSAGQAMSGAAPFLQVRILHHMTMLLAIYFCTHTP